MSETRLISCPQCKAELEVDADYFQELQGGEIECPECKAALPVQPAPAEPKRPVKPLSMRKTGRAGARAGTGNCPHCGATLDEEAVLCVACGTDLKTGKPLAAGVAKAPPGGGRRLARMALGVVAVAVILGAGYHMMTRLRQQQAEEQSRLLTGSMVAARNAHNLEAALQRLEQALDEAPLASNREEAQTMLQDLRAEVAQVPERTRRLRAALDEAEKEPDLSKRIALVAPLLEASRGAADIQEAERLVREWRQAARLQSQLAAEMARASDADSPAEGVRILQAAIPRFGNAPNLPEAYRLLADLQRQAQAQP